MFLQQRMEAVVSKLSGLHLEKRVVDEHKRWLSFLELRLKPVELCFTKRADVRVEIRRCIVLRAAQEVIQVDEFVALVVQNRVGIGVELSFEQAMTHLA